MTKKWTVICKRCGFRCKLDSIDTPKYCTRCGSPCSLIFETADSSTFNDYLSDKIRSILTEEAFSKWQPSDIAPHHRERWTFDVENQLRKNLDSFIRHYSTKLGRTEAGIRIKLLRILKREYPTDWEVAQKS